MVSQIISAIFNSIVSGVLMTGFLLYLGASAEKVGVILSIPLLASVLQVPLAKMWYYFYKSKQKINQMVLVARLSIIAIIFIPLLITKETTFIMGFNISLRVAVTSIILLFAYIFGSSSGIQLNYWMVNSIDSNIRGTFFAFRDRIVSGLMLVISFSTSYIVDILQKTSNEYIGFAIIFALATVFSVADYIVIAKIQYTESIDDNLKISIRQWASVIKGDKRFLLLLTYIFLLNFSMNIAGPYYNTYMLNVLNLTYTKIMIFTIVQVLVQISVSSVWGKIANCFNWKNILSCVTLVLGLQFLLWTLVIPKTIGLILIIFIISGMIATGLSISQFMLPYEYIKSQSAMIYLSLVTAISAFGGFLGSITGSNIISEFKNIKVSFFSIELGAMQINMVASGIMVLLTVCYSRYVLKK
jgi:hypothetical protein